MSSPPIDSLLSICAGGSGGRVDGPGGAGLGLPIWAGAAAASASEHRISPEARIATRRGTAISRPLEARRCIIARPPFIATRVFDAAVPLFDGRAPAAAKVAKVETSTRAYARESGEIDPANVPNVRSDE